MCFKLCYHSRLVSLVERTLHKKNSSSNMLLFDSNYYSLALHTASDLCIIMDYKMRSLQVKTKEVREKEKWDLKIVLWGTLFPR